MYHFEYISFTWKSKMYQTNPSKPNVASSPWLIACHLAIVHTEQEILTTGPRISRMCKTLLLIIFWVS